MKFIQFLALILSAFTFWACDNTRIYEQNIDIHEKTWNIDSVPGFSFNIDNTETSYNLYYNIRNTRAYPYRNLYLRYSIEDSLGQKISSGLHNVDLFDPKTGKPYGSGLGDLYDHQVLALENFQFKDPGLYHFTIQQYMRMENLPEIVSVGLRVENSEQ